MDISKIMNELRQERERIDEAIAALTRCAQGAVRRGRPPLWLGSATPEGKKRHFSAETRKRMAAAQKKRWAKA